MMLLVSLRLEPNRLLTITPNVSKALVEGDEGATLARSNFKDYSVRLTLKPLRANGQGIVPGFLKKLGKLLRKVFIYLEEHRDH